MDGHQISLIVAVGVAGVLAFIGLTPVLMVLASIFGGILF